MVSQQLKQQRKQLITPDASCFYCGLGFTEDDFSITPAGDTDWTKREKDKIKPSIEHLLAIARGGTAREENCVVAHKICNVMVGDMTPVSKIRFKTIFAWLVLAIGRAT